MTQWQANDYKGADGVVEVRWRRGSRGPATAFQNGIPCRAAIQYLPQRFRLDCSRGGPAWRQRREKK